MIEFALLGFLRQEPLHGYEIYQRLSASDGLWLVWRIKQSRLYAMLDRLEEAGHIQSTLSPQENRPARKILHLTPLGEQTYFEWVQSPVSHGRELRLEFLAKLYFALQEGDRCVAKLVRRQTERCRQWLAAERAEQAQTVKRSAYTALVHRFRAGQRRAMLEWLADCEQFSLQDDEPVPKR